MGLEICKVLLEQGHTVYGVARSYTEDFKKLESEYADKLLSPMTLCSMAM